MHADLVRAPGVDAHAAAARRRPAPPRPPRWTAPARPRGASMDIFLRWTGWRPMAASIVPLRGRGHAVHHRQVLLLHRARRELRGQPAVRLVALRDHDEPRRPAVQPVDDAGPQHAAHAGQVARRGGGARSPACPRRVPAPGWTTRPAGLSTTSRCASSCTTRSGMSSRLRAPPAAGSGTATATRWPGADPRRGARGRAVHGHRAVRDQRLDAGAAQLGQAPAPATRRAARPAPAASTSTVRGPPSSPLG